MINELLSDTKSYKILKFLKRFIDCVKYDHSQTLFLVSKLWLQYERVNISTVRNVFELHQQMFTVRV